MGKVDIKLWLKGGEWRVFEKSCSLCSLAVIVFIKHQYYEEEDDIDQNDDQAKSAKQKSAHSTHELRGHNELIYKMWVDGK